MDLNAILCHMSDECPISGNLFYLIEYFIFLKRKISNIKFVLIDINLDLSKICERYNKKIDETDILIIKKKDILKYHFKSVLTTDRIYKYLNRLISAKNIHLFQTWESLNNQNLYDFIKKDSRCIIYNESEDAGDLNYIRKINFEIYKHFDEYEDNYFLHMPPQRLLNKIQFDEIYNTLDENKKILVYTPNKIDFLEDKNNIEIHTTPIENLFSKFSEYIYIVPFGFDYSPRLLIECFYYQRKILNFRSFFKYKDGGTKRLADILSGDISKYFLTENDELFLRF